MGSKKVTLKAFLSCFKNFDFNILKKDKKRQEHSPETNRASIIHLKKMLQKAKRELSSAYKSHKMGKINSDELFDFEWHVHEIEAAIKNIEDNINNEK